MRQKQVFKTIFLLTTIFLIILPFLVTFNEALTKIVEKFKLYMVIQDYVVPLQIRLVSVLVSPFPINFTPSQTGFIVNGTFLTMTWNCIGWQSLLLLAITLTVGFKNAKYTLSSKLEAVAIGILGTFLINLLRLTIIVIIFAYLRPIYTFVYHDYLAAIVTVIWLFFFWWFAYRYVLEEKKRVI